MHSLPRLDLKGNRPIRSIYPMPECEDWMMERINWCVLMFGRSEGGKASLWISASKVFLKGCTCGNSYISFFILSWMSLFVDVDCRCCLSWFRCHASVAMHDGRFFCINCSSKLSHVVKCLFFIALIKVILTGEKQAP